MAPRASTSEEGGRTAAAPNFDYKRIPGIVKEIETHKAQIDAIMQEAKDKCASLRETIAGIKKAAAKDGCPREELNSKLRERNLIRAAEACRENLTDEQQDNYDRMSKELGDFKETGLGAAALGRLPN